MDETRLSDEVRRFILSSIPSVPHLEALLLIRAESSATGWSAGDVARRLYVDPPVAAGLLAHLADAGLARKDGPRYRYEPATPELATVVADVEAAYARNLVAVANLIHSLGDRKAQRFADAFRWRKDS